MFIRYAAFHLQQLSAKRQRETTEHKSIEASKEAKDETDKKEKRDNKSQEKEAKEKKHKKESAKKAKEHETTEKETKAVKKVDDLLLNENYSEIDTDVAKKIVESITDSICSGANKHENDCKS